ncbi:MAG: hypothetical protein FWG34_11575 [Oscillospiraceae bacterium]|jgi:hypothetical protein|nr:hypothetical protein [Oscillospiraceae bacterium]
MSGAYLTAEEIYAIDNLTEDKLLDYLSVLPSEKKELVSHIFSKNRSARAWKAIADEREEGIKGLVKKLEENGFRV